jgi:hypothetical protein
MMFGFRTSDKLQILPKWPPSWENLEFDQGFNSVQSLIFLKPNMHFTFLLITQNEAW